MLIHLFSIADSFIQHLSQEESVENIPTPEDNVDDSIVSSDEEPYDESTGSSDFPSDYDD